MQVTEAAEIQQRWAKNCTNKVHCLWALTPQPCMQVAKVKQHLTKTHTNIYPCLSATSLLRAFVCR